MKARIVLSIALFCAAGLCPIVNSTAFVSMQESMASRIVETGRAVYEYRLRGDVRLLIF